MQFISARELAAKWGVDPTRIHKLARDGRIEGAAVFGRSWMFPTDAQKPADGRTRAAKAAKEEDPFFRFPLYVNFEESAYSPPLDAEERQLRLAQKAFQSCCFDQAEELLRPLSEEAENLYVRLSALYHRSYIAMYDNSPDFDTIQRKLKDSLAQDFPHKKEMMLLRYGFDADNTVYQSVLEEFTIDPAYPYHPSAYYTMLLLSFIPIQNGDFALMAKLRYDTQELLCQQMEREGYYLEAQKLHYLCAVVFQLQNNEKKMLFHIRRGLELAQEHTLYFAPAYYGRFYPNVTQKALRGFPEEFIETIRTLVGKLQQGYTRFVNDRDALPFLGHLSSEDYEYAFLANQGYTNRQIASRLKRSEKLVSQRYHKIYEKLGIKTKQELVELINSTHKSGQV